eukprot:Awhi_evm1s4961
MRRLSNLNTKNERQGAKQLHVKEIETMMSNQYKMKLLGPLSFILDQYIKEILETYSMKDSLVGSLLYLALATSPDIAFVVTRIERLVPKPTESTTEAELISRSLARKEVNWLRNILAELNLPLSAPTIIYQDCQPAIAVIRRQGTHQRTKHLSRNVMRTREEIAHQRMQIEYIHTTQMTADIFTKFLLDNNILFYLNL